MKKYSFLGILFFLLCNCGIPSYDFIDGPVCTTENSVISIKIEQTGLINGFELYSRYYLPDADSSYSSFEDLSLSDMPTESKAEDYIINKGFNKVEFQESTFTDIESDYREKFFIDNSATFQIQTGLDDYLVLVNTVDNSTEYKLISNYKTKYRHYIGEYQDDYGEDFLARFKSDNGNITNIPTLKIEFVIINKGISSTLESLWSLPVYINPIDIQTNN